MPEDGSHQTFPQPRTTQKPNMKNIYLIRHAQSAANALPAHGGSVQFRNAEIPLTPLGEAQAAALAQWLQKHAPPPDAIFVSPYLRTQQTARPFLEKNGLKAAVLHDLHEFNYLAFDNVAGKKFMALNRLAEAYWQRGDADYRDGADCDSFTTFYQRVMGIRAHFRTLPDGNYIAFSHGLWIGMLLWQLVGRSGNNMAHFRAFEQQVRPRNTETYLLRSDGQTESIAKVRSTREDDHAEAM